MILPRRAKRLITASTISALSVASSAGAPAPAEACWDGYAAHTERATVAIQNEGEWSPGFLRQAADSMARIDALLPPDTSLDAVLGVVSICGTEPTCTSPLASFETDANDIETLLDATARALGASKNALDRARKVHVIPFTVQVLAARDAIHAERMVDRIREQRLGEHGFIEVGGFPAWNSTAHDIVGTDRSGARIHRVFVGAFLQREEAMRQAAALRRAGLTAFVRTI